MKDFLAIFLTIILVGLTILPAYMIHLGQPGTWALLFIPIIVGWFCWMVGLYQSYFE